MQQLKRGEPSNSPIHLDANAAFPLSPRVRDALPRLLDAFGPGANVNSLHALGKKARRFLLESKEKVELALDVAQRGGSLLWLSSGSRANQVALESLSALSGSSGYLSPLVHDSVRKFQKRHSFWTGHRSQIASPGFISFIWVHNESGEIIDLLIEIQRIKRFFPSILVHVDAVQAWGRLDLAPIFACADLITLSGSKIGALSGVGLLWISPRIIALGWKSYAEQSLLESEAAPLALATLGPALEDLAIWPSSLAQISAQRDDLEKDWQRTFNDRMVVVAQDRPRVANTSLLLFHGVNQRAVADALDLEGIRVGTGAACRSGTAQPSPSLLYWGFSSDLAQTATRLSWSTPLSEEALNRVRDRVKLVVQRAMQR